MYNLKIKSGVLRTFTPAVFVAILIQALGILNAVAQDSTGIITGQVMDVRTGQYLDNARVSVRDAGLQTLTDQYGQFSFRGVPTGIAEVTVFYTGYYSTTQTIEVNSSITSQVEIGLKSRGSFASEDEIFELDAYVVKGQFDATAAAIHEQRFAENNISVIDADALGNITEGNIGEFVKFLPGISINYVAADVRSIEVRGMGDMFTSVTVDGNMMASASSSNMNRTFELEQVSLNNVERVEVVKVPTSDMPANSLGGSVNLVSKSAFERDGREIRYNVYMSANSEALTFGKTDGPGNDETYKIRPGLKFTYADVYNDGKLGIIVNYLNSNQFNSQHRSRFRWSFEDYEEGYDNPTPVLRRYQMQDGPKITHRESANIKLDYKISDNTILLTSFQWNDYISRFRNTNVQWDTNVLLTPDNQTSQSGVIESAAKDARIDFAASWRNKYGNTWHGDARIQHTIGDLKLEFGGFWSKATNHYRSTVNGFVENAEFSLIDIDGILRFSDFGGNHDINNTVTIEHIDGAGVNNPGLGVSDLGVFHMSAITPYRPKDGEDLIMGWNADATYRLGTSGGLTGYLKAGLKYTSQERNTLDIRERWYHTGNDAERDTADEISGAGFLNDAYAYSDPHYGLASVISWQDMGKAKTYWDSNQDQFTLRGVDGTGVNYIQEDILAGYAMASINVFQSKGTITGGLRWEKTKLTALGDSDDRKFDSNFDGFYPSISLRYDITDHLVGRLAFAQTIGRQNFSDLLPNIQINYGDEETDGSVTANNLGLKPQQADNFDATLEYYTDNAGVISVGYFHKEISDYMRAVGRTVIQSDIDSLGLPGDTLGFEFSTAVNAGTATINGFEFNVIQKLNFIPESIGRFSTFINGTFLDIEGDFGTDEVVTDLEGFVSETYNLGLSYEKAGFTANLKFTHKGRELRRPYTSDGASAIGDVYEFNDVLEQVDLDLEYQFNRNYVVYFSARNLNNAPQNRVLRANSIDLYIIERSEEYGVQFSLGVKGSF